MRRLSCFDAMVAGVFAVKRGYQGCFGFYAFRRGDGRGEGSGFGFYDQMNRS